MAAVGLSALVPGWARASEAGNAPLLDLGYMGVPTYTRWVYRPIAGESNVHFRMRETPHETTIRWRSDDPRIKETGTMWSLAHTGDEQMDEGIRAKMVSTIYSLIDWRLGVPQKEVAALMQRAADMGLPT